MHVAVKEQGDDVVFLHKIVPGRADRSYGLHVAKIAGIPPAILKRAALILADLEHSSQQKKVTSVSSGMIQQSLFEIPQVHPLLQEISELDIDSLSPRQALDYLYDLANRIRSSQVI